MAPALYSPLYKQANLDESAEILSWDAETYRCSRHSKTKWRVWAFIIGASVLGLTTAGQLRSTLAEPSPSLQTMNTIALEQASSSNVHLVFPLDKRHHDRNSCKTLFAAIMHGYNPTIINWNLTGTMNEMYTAKIPGTYDYLLNSLPTAHENDLVVMSDAFDVWFQLGPRALSRRFAELGSKIVIGADEFCWPNNEASYECTHAPNSTIPSGVFWEGRDNKYANSGTVIGNLRDMRDFYQRLTTMVIERPSENDQLFFNEILAERDCPFKIDYWYRLVWTSAGPGVPVVLPVRHDVDGDLADDIVPYSSMPPMAFHELTGELPVALHFNADASKSMREEMFGRLWFTKINDSRFSGIIRRRVQQASIHFAHDGTQRAFTDVCPRSLLDLHL